MEKEKCKSTNKCGSKEHISSIDYRELLRVSTDVSHALNSEKLLGKARAAQKLGADKQNIAIVARIGFEHGFVCLALPHQQQAARAHGINTSLNHVIHVTRHERVNFIVIVNVQLVMVRVGLFVHTVL